MTKKTIINKKTKIIIDAEFLRFMQLLITDSDSRKDKKTAKNLKKFVNKIIRRI